MSAMRRIDGYVNFFTGLGNALGQTDKVASAELAYTVEKQPEYYEALYESDALARRIVDRPVGDCFRKGFEVTSDAQFDKAALMKAWRSVPIASPMPEYGMDTAFKRAMALAKIGGGSALVLGIDDGSSDTALPLNPKSIRKFRWVQPLSRDALTPYRYYDKDSDKFGQVEIWRVQWPAMGGGSAVAAFVHESRMVLFDGEWLTDRSRAQRQGWGASIYRSLEHELKAQGMSWAAMSTMLQDASQAVMKIQNLHAILAEEEDGDHTIEKRMRLIDYCRSVARAIAVDAESEGFEYHDRTFAGVPDVAYALMFWLSAQTDIPVTLLFGRSPAGLNATGENDVRNYYDKIGTVQTDYLKPRQVHVMGLFMMQREGPLKAKPPKNFDIEHRSLWELDDVQKADVRLKVAQADQIYLEHGVALPEEIGVARFGGEKYSMETAIDVDLRAEEEEPSAPAGEQGTMGARAGAIAALVKSVAGGEIPRETGIATLKSIFGMTPEQAEEHMGTAGNGFEPTPKQMPHMPTAKEQPADDADDEKGEPGGQE
jgi:phage-related protein (TIGR01555 family)